MKNKKLIQLIYLFFNLIIFYIIMFEAQTDLISFLGGLGGIVSSIIFLLRFGGVFE